MAESTETRIELVTTVQELNEETAFIIKCVQEAQDILTAMLPDQSAEVVEMYGSWITTLKMHMALNAKLLEANFELEDRLNKIHDRIMDLTQKKD